MNTLPHPALASLIPLDLIGCSPKLMGSETVTQRLGVIRVRETKPSRAPLNHVGTGWVFQGVRTGHRYRSLRQHVRAGDQWELPYTPTTRHEGRALRVSLGAGQSRHVSCRC